MTAPTLRTRATVLGGLVFAVLLGVGALLLVATLDSRLTTSSDQVDRARLRELLQLAESGDLPAVAELSDLISRSAHAHAEGRGEAAEALWDASARALDPGAR